MFARYRIREFFGVECPACFQKTHRSSASRREKSSVSLSSNDLVSVRIGLHALELNVLSDVFDGFAIFSSLPRRTTLLGFSTELALADDCLISLISSSILAISILGLKLNDALSQ
ncbi:hypothetical protein RCL_jg18984.t1 [Rhizophagus clarus]|uniref:Uncharacterized protein n=1 Tax=Rhizophagus clarus TaxID=94130 RepID=A0A8H3QX69_9GLOM|nr:hypothetical protein RCL_jg18984.t1 [Rhizophagus clarus]